MEIRELRLGNWVKVDDLEPEKISLKTFAVLEQHPMHVNKFEPIPISEEWIKKFDFEDWGTKQVNRYEKEKTFALYNSIDGESTFKLLLIWEWYGLKGGDIRSYWGVRIDSDTIYPYRIKYVHDLQNVFFLFSGYELNEKQC